MKKIWIFILSLLIFGSVLFMLLHFSVERNEGHFIYALDDGYIHMTIARNLATHGSWGISPGEFCSASSSLLWTFLLSFFYVLGINSVMIPFILNAFFACLLLWILFSQFSKDREKMPWFWLLVSILGIMFICPLVPLVFVGMEHILHILISLLFLITASRAVSEEGNRHIWIWTILLGVALTAVRYEGLFLVFVVCGLLLLKRRVFKALFLGAVSFIPIAGFGFISIGSGGSFLPNSLLLKGNIPELNSLSSLFLAFGGRAILTMIREPQIMVLVIMACVLFIIRCKKSKFWEASQMLLVISVLVTLFHLQFAKTGWFFRYEAYLVVMLIFSLLRSAVGSFKEKELSLFRERDLPRVGAIGLLALVLIAPLIYRAGLSHVQTVAATNNIYAKQYQMVEFINSYYPKSEIVINDLGALSYYTDAELLDLWGLGSHEIVGMKRDQTFTVGEISRILQSGDFKLAMIYDSWFPQEIPEFWIKVGDWTVQDVVCQICHTISFYAFDVSQAAVLATQMNLFSDKLPVDVESKILIPLDSNEENHERRFNE